MLTDDVTAEELVKRLWKISSLVAAELAAADDPDAPGGDMTHCLAAVRSLQSLTDEILARLVTAARGRGVTWQAIGDALGTSRQAAFQRFGNPTDPRTGKPMKKPTDSEFRTAVEKAEAFLDAIEKHEWQKAEELAGPRAGWQLDAERLADAWAQVIALGGELERRGTPTPLALSGGVVVVEEPLHMEAADLVARVSYNRDGDMVGLWFLPSGQALAGEERQ